MVVAQHVVAKNVDVYDITHRTRPESVKTYSKAAREAVSRLVAALAHREADQDDISAARVSEAQFALTQILKLDAALEKFSNELDKVRRMVQDKFYDLEDDLQELTPSGIPTYRATQPKGTTYVSPYGQAKPTQPSTSASIPAAGNPPTVGNVRTPSTGAGQPAAGTTTVEQLT